MAAITASMVAELRGKTDAPMMECKKALTEADGDMAKAEELLRVKLGTKAGKAASRITAEGVVASFIDGTTGALVEVNSETDFVSKNDSFIAMAKAAAELGIITMRQNYDWDMCVERYWMPFLARVERERAEAAAKAAEAAKPDPEPVAPAEAVNEPAAQVEPEPEQATEAA